jgi:hypothetical protein
MNSILLRRLNAPSVTTFIMRCTWPLAIVQILCVILFAGWMLSL